MSALDLLIMKVQVLYIVSSFSITGTINKIQRQQIEYFERITQLNLINPKLICFGIYNRKTFNAACDKVDGAIIGSAFIKALSGENTIKNKVSEFIKSIL